MNRTPDADAAAHFKAIDALFDAALDLPAGERRAHVEHAAAHDAALRDETLALLRAHDRSAGFLETPAHDAVMVRVQEAVGAGYRLRSRLGAGGMASVYLADDLRHARQVAIKAFTLPADAGGDATGAADRFLGEIRVMAQLQHSHLLPLFDSGRHGALLYYVMPFVRGGTLRERLQRESPLPVSEAVRLVHAMAGGLAHAHAKGVIHRDLKPANILLRDGEPLVADFGIALALSGAAVDGARARVTKSGMLVGTPQYMSPEQATGEHAIDARTDVYSLGALLYEMLVGDPPHVASSVQGVLAKVRAERPTPVHALRDSVPPGVSDVVDHALAKRPADRFPSVRAFDEALADAVAAGAALPRSAGAPRRASRAVLRVVVAGAVVIAAVAVTVRMLRAPAAGAPVAARFIVAPLPDAAIGRAPTITPDGATLVYPGSAATGRRLFVRPVNALQARALPGTEGALSSFVSPDGRWIGFITSDDKLQKTPVDGGAVTVLGGTFRYTSAAWAGTDRIVLDSYGAQGLSWISASGGPQHQLTRLDTLRHDSGHATPFVLPDGMTVLFTIQRDRAGPGAQQGELGLVVIDTADRAGTTFRRLGIQIRRVVGFDGGWLLYTVPDGSGIFAVRLETKGGRLQGEPVPVLQDAPGGIDAAALARNGTLLYTRLSTLNAPVLVDSTGVATPLLADVSGRFMNPRLSPDGRRLAIQSESPQGSDIAVFDIATRTPSRVTSTGSAIGPSWNPDGQRLVYFSTSGARDAIWQEPADGRTAPQRLLAAQGVFAVSQSADGRHLLFQRMQNGVWGVWYADAVVDAIPRPLVVERFDALMPALAPDGRWLAYAANETGRHEIYVRPFPGPGAAVRVSEQGGVEPAWSPDGRRLFFRSARQMFVASIDARGIPSVTSRRVLFTDAFDGDMPMPHRNYDVTRDGTGFVMIAASPGAAPQTVVVLDWFSELHARLASAK